MNSNALGGGILFATIALLWVAVLVPSFARGREFRAAEQNAARLQRTLRLLAETAEIPEEHIVEANAKEALAHEKRLKIAQKNLEQSRKKELHALRAGHRVEQMKKQRALESQQALLRQERLRSAKFKPLRVSAAIMAVLGFIGSLVGIGLWIGGFGPLPLFGFLVAAGAGVSILVTLAPGARKSVHAKVQPVHKFLPQEMPDFKEEPADEQSRSHIDHALAQAKARAAQEQAQVMARARAEARKKRAQALAAKENQPGSMLLGAEKAKLEATPKEATPKEKPTQEAPAKVEAISGADPQHSTETPHSSDAAPSELDERLQRMGVIDSAPVANLDDMLKRRRQA